ncbi:MAG: prepilin-type N-terminal cleavage/methylation domain-containing protein [bacterium]|nr:prepilin-type N-terminal cleavage/methylation domain-containing protein [bacterium]
MAKIIKSGFSVVELLIVVVVLGVVGFATITVMNRPDKAEDATQSAVANDVQSAPEVVQGEDLNEAEAVLEATDPELSNSDASQLDGELNAF